MPAYPRDCATCMSKEGPLDPRFRVPGGTLLYKLEGNTRFPYIYEILTHALVHSPEVIKQILYMLWIPPSMRIKHVQTTSLRVDSFCPTWT